MEGLRQKEQELNQELELDQVEVEDKKVQIQRIKKQVFEINYI